MQKASDSHKLHMSSRRVPRVFRRMFHVIAKTLLLVEDDPDLLEVLRLTFEGEGFKLVLAEAGTELGGRVSRECKLPGLAAWRRVRDYRALQLQSMPNVELYFESALDAEQVKAIRKVRVFCVSH